MPINTDLLIASPTLQDALVDKTGIPMAAGTITCYQDNSRTTLKNWFYQSGTPGNYTYIPLPNPLTLSAAGTICDINGVDTIPFFYPYDEQNETTFEPYYITIVNYNQTNQITRANFPFVAEPETVPVTGSEDLENYIINNGFWRNVGTINLTNVTAAIVAPSQHDGFSMPDIMFIKNTTGGADTCTFERFPLTDTPILMGDITPEFYLNHTCTAGASEIQKCYQFPISLHVNTLASVPYTVTIQAQNASSTTASTITLQILQFTGTGTASPSPSVIAQTPLVLTNAWAKYTLTDIFPPTAGLTLGQGQDDALYLQVQMPLGVAFEINFTKPSIYLSSTEVPVNNFQTYDQVDTVINSPRTGDIRTSINAFYPYGWLPMNNGVIGLSVSGVVPLAVYPGYARGNGDTWPLYNLLWNLAKPFDTGSTYNPISQMYSNASSVLALANYGANAYADFIANNALALTRSFGAVMMGTVPASALMTNYAQQNQAVTAANSGGILVFTGTVGGNLWQGAPITFNFTSGGSLPGNIAANTIYYITNIVGATFNVSTTYSNAIAGTPVVMYATTIGSNVVINFNPTGASIGEYGHTQAIAELPSHSHNLTGRTGTTSTTGGTQGASANTLLVSTGGDVVTQSTGSGASFNLVNPSVLYNIYIKM
jgi:hypothetical protein